MKKKLIKAGASLGLLLICLTGAWAQNTPVVSLMETFYGMPDERMVAAHRGSHIDFAENSIPSIDHAIKTGVDIVEIDVRQTKDKYLVIMHDETVDRTTTGQGKVADYTLNELKSLRLLHQGKPTDQQIPTLEEALMIARDAIIVDLDFKTDDLDAVKECYKIIRKLNVQEQVLFFVYDKAAIPFLLNLDEDILIMPRARNAEDVKEVMKAYKNIKVIHIDPSFYSDAMAKEMKLAGVRIWANTLGKYDEAERKSGTGFDSFFKDMSQVNIIQTDLPELLKKKISSKL